MIIIYLQLQIINKINLTKLIFVNNVKKQGVKS